MGDRCYMEVTVRKTDAPKFEEILGLKGTGVPQTFSIYTVAEAVSYVVEESNYGDHEPRMEAAEAGCAFIGFHTSGHEYPACEFAAADGVMVEALTDTDSGLLVPIDVENGRAVVQPHILADVQRYLDLRKRAEELMAAACQAEDGQ